MSLVVILLSVIILLLIAINCALFFYSKSANKKIDILLDNGKIKDQKDVLFSLIEKIKTQEADIAQIQERVKDLEDISQRTFQKIGIVRFNPFAKSGGNQSFVIALLDKKNNGFVISSLFVDQSSRIYVKTVLAGKSEYSLSEEETEAIARATK